MEYHTVSNVARKAIAFPLIIIISINVIYKVEVRKSIRCAKSTVNL